jgi:hypothetical protein
LVRRPGGSSNTRLGGSGLGGVTPSSSSGSSFGRDGRLHRFTPSSQGGSNDEDDDN